MLYFRFPFSDSIFTVNENSNKKSVSFLSFDETESIDFYGNIEEFFFNENILSNQISTELLEFKQENQFEYEAKLGKVIEFIKENQLSKLVISRRMVFDFEEKKINLSQTFLNLCKSYPNAFVYFFIKDGKCWIGAFSELLGKFDKKTSEFETMSLAGTLPVNETWTAKEIEEQKPVTDFIKNILKNYSSEVEQSETYDHISGNIKHLRTDFKAKIMSEDLENLISELHPTPAVCGIPKHLCKSAIEKFESHPRNLYAGYIKVETDDFIYYFVNLRCASFFKNYAFLFVGGGITLKSDAQKEWQETELKSLAVQNNLVFE